MIKPERDEIFAAAEANDVPVDYLLFADDGHGLSKMKNQI